MSDKISRRKFLYGAIGLGAAAAGAYWLPKTSFFRQASNSVHTLAGDLPANYLRQIVTQDMSTSRRIMWEAAEALEGASVEYRMHGAKEGDSSLVEAVDETFADDGRTTYQYGASLEHLKPNTDYEYRVRSSKAAGDWHSLHTPEANQTEFKALIFPDSQSSDYTDWKNLAQFAWKTHSDAAFFLNMGDIVDNGEDHTQWQAWLGAVDSFSDQIPFAPVMGNHETYNLQWKVRLPEAYLHYFDVPENGSSQFQRYYYSFDYGDVHFIVLNSQWDETNDFKEGLLDEQLAWFQADVQATKKKWKVVLIHKDVLQYRIHNRPERKEGFTDVGEAFMPLFDKYQIDIVFTAHLHTYRDRGHIYNKQSSEQGPLYILTGVAGNVRYPGLWIDHALDKKVAPQPETDNFLTLEAKENQLTVACFLPDGTEIDRVSVEKG